MTVPNFLRVPFLVLRAAMWFGLAASLAYVVASLAALVDGYALPTAAIFHWGYWVRAAGEHDHYAAHFLLLVTSLCAVATWLSAMIGARSYELELESLDKFLQFWGLPLTLCLFIFSMSGTWAGLPRPGDFNGASIGGLIPFSDAHGYFAAAQDQARDGYWNGMALRRPFAAAFRSILMGAAGFSYAQMLLIQVILCAAAVWVAARSILIWRGPLACLAFVALSLMFCRSFLATSLTEPLGLIWSFLSVACFVESFRRKSLQFALLGVAWTFMALMTRMGAMFLLPALLLWVMCCFGDRWRNKFRIGVILIAIVGTGLATNFALQKIYGRGADISGSNFAYVICGLSIGQDWSSCPVRYAVQLKQVGNAEKAQTDFLYAKAVENIVQDPATIVRRLAVSAALFARALPSVMLNGYLTSPPTRWLPTSLFLSVSLVGLVILIVCRAFGAETLFWLFSMLAIWVSSAFVYYDDGMRVMTGSYPLIATLVVSGLFTRDIQTVTEMERPARQWWGGLAAALLLLLSIPWIEHRVSRPAITAKAVPNQQLVFGGKRISGFLVVADDQPLRKDVPSLHLTEFAKIVALSNNEIYQPLLKEKVPQLPFGFIVAPRMEAGLDSNNQFIVPAHVMLDQKVKAWKFTTADWSKIEGNSIYWYLVTDAQPIDLPAK
ncbi:hypothetical protein [Bradyrhizobium sp. AUGA SZCCT0431]|uniref:hypothetical protein n=1 Tax=Bradyrhizobium sp. AUGA SZCCT0431 TaxID=2807674 RepID=UPI001BA68005|nr:hypothetical protein [Bradyrhizobium sp. AUGA SZCCT0431]MBR1142363.1 hypothetical protein [Bradyrhizobium sp. AUGA SZCCT0431]